MRTELPSRRALLIETVDKELLELTERATELQRQLGAIERERADCHDILAALRGQAPAPVKPQAHGRRHVPNEEQIRDFIVSRRSFSAVEFGRHFGYDRPGPAAKRLLPPFEKRGIVRQVGTPGPKGARVTRRYEYVPPEPSFREAVRSEPQERNGAEPVAGTGHVALDKRIAEILRPHLGKVTVSHDGQGHLRVTSKATGQSFGISSTPSAEINHVLRQKLRGIGIS